MNNDITPQSVFNESSEQPLVGISACLLGQPVRYDGGHKKCKKVVPQLGEHVEYRAFCPEMGIGLGAPRATIRLEGGTDQASLRAIQKTEQPRDLTETMKSYTHDLFPQLKDLSGFILKSKSPSCGMSGVKVYKDAASKAPHAKGTGIFAAELASMFPLMPIEEEGRLNDAHIRESFLIRVFAFCEWRSLLAEGLTPTKVQRFHATYKFALMAHSNEHYKKTGRILAEARKNNLLAIASEYFTTLMEGLTQKTTRGSHVNVLQHLMGYLKTELTSQDKEELQRTLREYLNEDIPLVVPLSLLEHYFQRHPHPYIIQQRYLNPHPDSRKLRSNL